MSRRKSPSKASLAPKLPRFASMTAAEYHADNSALGRSGLWTFCQSRRQYEAEFVTKDAPVRDKTKKMDIGTLCHAGLLEPEKFPDGYAVIPDKLLDSRGYETTNAAKDFRAKNEQAGKVVLKSGDFQVVRSVVGSVACKLEDLGWLGVESRREQAIYWTEPTTGMLCKTLLDWLIVTKTTAYVLDFKTSGSADPEDFKRIAESKGYFLQDAQYSEGAGQVTGLPVEFLFLVGETEFPFRCSVNVLSPDDRRAAAEFRLRKMAELAQCLKTGDWTEPWESKIVEMRLRSSCYL